MSKKTNYSYIGIAFIILLFGILFIPKIIDRIQNKDIIRNESRSDSNTKAPVFKNDLAYIKINGEAKKMPAFSFTNQNNKTITNKNYDGKVYIVEFFFTSCPSICPKMNANLVAIQNTEGIKDNSNFGIAAFTINPKYDTPEQLKLYAQKIGATNANWNFLTGDKDTIYKLSNEDLNLYAAKDDAADGGFEHSGNFVLVDKKGYIRSRIDANGNPIIYYNGIISEAEQTDDEGTPQDITSLKQDLLKLLHE